MNVRAWTWVWTTLGFVAWLGPTPNAARADFLYGLQVSDNGSARLLVIDPATGAATSPGTVDFDGGEALELDAAGNLLAIGWDRVTPLTPDDLFTIDPVTLAVQRIGSVGAIFVEGLAVDANGVIYGSADPDFDPFADHAKDLVRIDRATGVGTVIGPFGPAFQSVEALAFSPSGVLYGFDIGTPDTAPAFITIDPTTGAGTLVASPPTNMLIYGMDFAPDGTLYGTMHNSRFGGPARLVTIDPTNGAITDIGPIGFDTVQGLVYVSAIPEPASVVLVGIGLAGIFLGVQRRARRHSPLSP